MPTAASLVSLKEEFVGYVSAFLLGEPKLRGRNDGDAQKLRELAKQIAVFDGEFVLKVVIFVRHDLNIRSTANYLLAVAADLPACQPYFKKYFKYAVRLPSDWLDVATFYQNLPDRRLSGRNLPACLRKAMVAKFPDFDRYQLGKYNKEAAEKRKRKKLKDAGQEVVEKKLTLKQMVRQLHITSPASNVMMLLGKKYPADEFAFEKTGMGGHFDAAKAHTRMKLPVPETWETQVSHHGNNAHTWESLIDHRKLPFMAMLRNLRNLIVAGISLKHHRWVLSKLKDEQTIINSRQFPFSFFSAYEAIDIDIDALARPPDANPSPTGDPAWKRRAAKKPRPKFMPTKELLAQYREALDTSIKLATVHNLKALHGCTSVFCSVADSMAASLGARNSSAKVKELKQAALLLGLMCKHMCEDCDFRLMGSTHQAVTLTEGTILDNMAALCSAASGEIKVAQSRFPLDYLETIIGHKQVVDHIVMIADRFFVPGDSDDGEESGRLQNLLKKYRADVNPNLIFVSLNVKSSKPPAMSKLHPNDVLISGFSAAILRYIAERGDGGQIAFIENIDKAKNIPDVYTPQAEKSTRFNAPPATSDYDPFGLGKAGKQCTWPGCAEYVAVDGKAQHERTCEYRVVHCPHVGCAEQVAVNRLMLHRDTCPYRQLEAEKRRRHVRLFVSSTFLDMQAERNLLNSAVFPEVKRRCAQHGFQFCPVDLRWGVPASASELEDRPSNVDICLDEVERCRPFFLGMVGHRYGWCPSMSELQASHHAWLGEDQAGKSMTHLEFEHGGLKFSSECQPIFLVRTGTKDVPQRFESAFFEQDAIKRKKLDSFRHDLLKMNNTWEYYGRWSGTTESGIPCLKIGDNFVENTVEALWQRIVSFFDLSTESKSNDPEDDDASKVKIQAEHMQHLSSSFLGRKNELLALQKLISTHISTPANLRSPIVVNGAVGAGKSALCAQLCDFLLHKDSDAVVLKFFAGITSHRDSVQDALSSLFYQARCQLDLDIETAWTTEEMIRLLPRVLDDASRAGRPVTVLLDGVDLLSEESGVSVDWIPTTTAVPVVVFLREESSHFEALAMRRPKIRNIHLSHLEKGDQVRLVRSYLWQYGKKLEESATNNQMRSLLRKPDAGNPLWLEMACEELRLFGEFEKVNDRIRSLGNSTLLLADQVIQRLERDFGVPCVNGLLSILVLGCDHIQEEDVAVLMRELDVEGVVWRRLLTSISQFITVSASTGRIILAQQLFTTAIAKRYLKSQNDRRLVHQRLAVFLERKIAPAAWPRDTLLCIVYHMRHAFMWIELAQKLTDLRYVQAKCEVLNGKLVPSLVREYSQSLIQAKMALKVDFVSAVTPFSEFVTSTSHMLSKHPHLTLQYAANFVSSAAVSRAANQLLSDERSTWVRWESKSLVPDPCLITVDGAPGTKVLCCDASPPFRQVACGYSNGSISLFEVDSGACVREIRGHAHFVSCCHFSPDGKSLVTGSYDSTLRVWHVPSGVEIQTILGHSRRVSACRFSNDGKIIASGSWDLKVMLWDASERGRRGGSHLDWDMEDCPSMKVEKPLKLLKGHNKPVSAVAFSPRDELLVTASWEGDVRVWDVASGSVTMVFHPGCSAIRSVDFSSNARWVAAASVDGHVTILDIECESVVVRMPKQNGRINCARFCGTHLLTGAEDCAVRLWDPVGLHLQMQTKASVDKCLQSLLLSDGVRILVASPSALVVLDRNGSEQSRHPPSKSRFSSNCMVQAGNRIFGGLEDGSLACWCLDTNSWAYVSVCSSAIKSLAVNPHNQDYLAIGTDGQETIVWCISKGEVLMKHSEHDGAILGVFFDGSGALLVSTSRDGNCVVWDCETDCQMATLSGHCDWVNCAAFTPNGDLLVTGSWDNCLMIWSKASSFEEHVVLKGHKAAVSCVCWSPEADRIASADVDGNIALWNTGTRQLLSIFKAHGSVIVYMAWEGNDGYILTVSRDGIVRYWSTSAGSELSSLHGHAAAVRSCAVVEKAVPTSDECSSLIVSSSDDGSMKMWKVLNCNIVGQGEDGGVSFSHAQAVSGTACSADAVILSCSRDGSAALWERKASGTTMKSLHFSYPNALTCCSIHPNGKMFALGSVDGVVSLVRANGERASGLVHSANVSSVSFHPEGEMLLSSSWDRTVRIWSSPSSPGHSQAKDRVLRGHRDWVNDACWIGPDRVASVSYDKTVKLYAPFSSPEAIGGHDLHQDWVMCCASQEEKLLSGDRGGSILLWDAGSQCKLWSTEVDDAFIHSVRFAGANRSLLCALSHSGRVWIGDSRSSSKVAEFYLQAKGTALSCHNDEIICGDVTGNIYRLEVKH